MKVLLIDDEPEILNCLSIFLSIRGHRSRGFIDPQRAVDEFMRERYDVVITDLQMPRMSGLQVMEAVRAYNPKAYVLVMTGDSTLSDSEIPGSERANACLTKPMNIRQLLEILSGIEKELNESSAYQEN